MTENGAGVVRYELCHDESGGFMVDEPNGEWVKYEDHARSISEASSFALAQRTAEALDAERYRYLRNAAGQYMGEEDGPTVCSGLSDLFEYHFGAEVDEVVDAAIARWKAAGSPLPPASHSSSTSHRTNFSPTEKE